MKSQQDIADAIADHARGLSVDGKLVTADVAALNALAASLFSRYTNSSAALSPGADAEVLIKQFEGCERKLADGRFQSYPDPGTGAAPWTIGWGSTGPDIKQGTIWTQAQCDARLEQDLAAFGGKVALLLTDIQTSQAQFDAMVSLAYNIGLGNFGGSTLLKLHRARDYAGARAQFAVWNKAAGRVMPGLIRRRAAEAALYGKQA